MKQIAVIFLVIPMILDQCSESVEIEPYYFIMKIDVNGERVWTIQQPDRVSTANSIAESTNSEIAVTGSIDVEDKENDNAYIGIFDSTGELLETKDIHFDYTDIGEEISATDDGGYFLNGVNRVDYVDPKYIRMFIMKLDADGNKIWSTSEKINHGFWSTHSTHSTADCGVAVMKTKST